MIVFVHAPLHIVCFKKNRVQKWLIGKLLHMWTKKEKLKKEISIAKLQPLLVQPPTWRPIDSPAMTYTRLVSHFNERPQDARTTHWPRSHFKSNNQNINKQHIERSSVLNFESPVFLLQIRLFKLWSLFSFIECLDHMTMMMSNGYPCTSQGVCLSADHFLKAKLKETPTLKRRK